MAAQVVQGSTTLDFTYDASRARVKQVKNSTETTYYLDDPITGLKSEKLVSGSTTTWRDYLMADGGAVGERVRVVPPVGDSTITYNYFVSDHQRSIIATTAATGTVSERLAYDPWGRRRNINGSDDTTCSLTSATSRGYTEEEHVPNVCLLNLNARMQNPLTGRFMRGDPLGGNYHYAFNNPVNATDRTGLYGSFCEVDDRGWSSCADMPWTWEPDDNPFDTSNQVTTTVTWSAPGTYLPGGTGGEGSIGSSVSGGPCSAGTPCYDAVIEASEALNADRSGGWSYDAASNSVTFFQGTYSTNYNTVSLDKFYNPGEWVIVTGPLQPPPAPWSAGSGGYYDPATNGSFPQPDQSWHGGVCVYCEPTVEPGVKVAGLGSVIKRIAGKMALTRLVGGAGEAAVRAVYNIGPRGAIRVNGIQRFPDGLTTKVLSEVKNVQSLSYTQQLRAYAQYAYDAKIRFDLYVRPTTKLSGPLEEAVGAGLVNLRYIPYP